MSEKLITRRNALVLTAASLVAMPVIVKADAPYKRRIKMQSLNSGEKLDLVYWADGEYIPGAFKQINWFMRDLRTNESVPIHPKLIDLLTKIARKTRSSAPIYTMSGYRSAKTNAWLAAHSDGVDPSSFHMRGMAVDITQDFSDPGKVYRAAKELKLGGAGFYPVARPFVHVDVGPVDTWVYPQRGRLDRAEEYDRMQSESKKT
ncbi:MAG: YcbK family protein [Parvibaculaceae bacterium]